MKRYPVITKKRGDKWYFRFTYGKRANGKTDDIQKAVGANEEEAKAVGEEIQTRLLEGKVTREELTSEYIEHVREELFDFSLSLFGDDSTSIEVNEPTQEQNVTESPTQEETTSQQTNSKRKLRKDKQKQEDGYPPFVFMVTACFSWKLKDGKSMNWLDAYLLGLIHYCEIYKPSKACTFSSYTIAEKINVSRSSVLRSVEKMEYNEFILRERAKGVAWKLTITSNTLPLLNTKSSSTGTPLNAKSSVTVTPLNKNAEKKQCHHDTTLGKSSSTMTPLNKKSSVTVTPNKYYYKDYYYKNSNDKKSKIEEDVDDNSFYDDKLKNCIKLWEDGTGRAIVPLQAEKLQSFIDDFSYEWTIHAMTYTFERDVKSPLPYINRILERWQASGFLKPWEHDSRPSSSQSQHKQRHEETREERKQRHLQEQKKLDALAQREEELYAK